MFLQKEDLKNSIYQYKIDEITEGNDTIVDQAMAIAEEEIRSYLTGNKKREWDDGRKKYDVDAILTASGDQRHSLILSHAIIIAKWWLVDLCNTDIIYEQAKERYELTTKYLKDLRDGDFTLNNLPVLDETPAEGEDDSQNTWAYGSRKKFNHE